METEKKGWGGAREGAGRPSKGSEKRVTFATRINAATASRISEQSKLMGLSYGKLVDFMVAALDARADGWIMPAK